MIYLFPTFPMRSEAFAAAGLPGLQQRLDALLRRAGEAVDFRPEVLSEPPPQDRAGAEHWTVQAHYGCIVENVALAEWLTQAVGACTLGCAYSMGLFAAAAHAGALRLEEALQLARDVCQAAHEGAPAGPWFIGAVVDFPHDRLRALVAASDEPLEVTDCYGPHSLLFTGRRDAVKAVLDQALAEGAPVTRLIPVTAPFHTRHLLAIEPRLLQLLAALDVRAPAFPILSSITQELLTTAEDVRAEFARNISRPMDWTATMRRLVQLGEPAAVEAGASTTLTELGRDAFPGCSYRDFRDLQVAT
jgi:[acyl-carrier-protein] S-malonyltransferase